MAKQFWKGAALLAPVPPTLVTCGTIEDANVLTIGWTGIVATHPPMTYISVRKSRYSYSIIEKNMEFVINIPTADMAKTVDFCGVKSKKDVDKIDVCNIKLEKSDKIGTPSISGCPISLECKVKQLIDCGSHTMFLSEIVGVAVEEDYIDKNGRLNLKDSNLLVYAHGEYFKIGKYVGKFGYSVKKKKKRK
jgi:flavin reductase (DIM6/NTAB) family NADH-FMN oxidoreductase RutF